MGSQLFGEDEHVSERNKFRERRRQKTSEDVSSLVSTFKRRLSLGGEDEEEGKQLHVQPRSHSESN